MMRYHSTKEIKQSAKWRIPKKEMCQVLITVGASLQKAVTMKRWQLLLWHFIIVMSSMSLLCHLVGTAYGYYLMNSKYQLWLSAKQQSDCRGCALAMYCSNTRTWKGGLTPKHYTLYDVLADWSAVSCIVSLKGEKQEPQTVWLKEDFQIFFQRIKEQVFL